MQLVLQTLIYDGKLEEVLLYRNECFESKSDVYLQVRSSAAVLAGKSAKLTYKISNPITPANYLTDVPCGKCPVADRCCVGGVISPETCSYMSGWLAMSCEDDIEDLR